MLTCPLLFEFLDDVEQQRHKVRSSPVLSELRLPCLTDRDVADGMRGHEVGDRQRHAHRYVRHMLAFFWSLVLGFSLWKSSCSVRRYLGPVRVVFPTRRASGCRPSMEWLVQAILLPPPPRFSLSQYSCTARHCQQACSPSSIRSSIISGATSARNACR